VTDAHDHRLRVLWLTKGLGPGGAERLLLEHAAAGDRTRFAYEAAYLLGWKQHLVADLEGLGVPVHGLGVDRDVDPRWIPRLARLLRARRFDIVHAHSPLPASVARVLVRIGFRRMGFVYTEHNRWPSHHWATRVVNRATFGLNDAVIAVSADVADSMSPRARATTRVITHGIDLRGVRSHLAERDAVRAELGVAPDEHLVVTVANLRANKRYPDLLAAARLVLDAGCPVTFAAAGQGPLEGEIRAEHERLGLGERVLLLGYRPDARRLIAGADLFVLASGHEGLPVAVMESFALGVPVVATAVGGLAEAVTPGVDGLLVPAGQPEALAAAIRAALEPDRHAALAAGATAAGERYSAAASVARVEAVYEAVVEEVRACGRGH